jgi:uncharacterized protein (DUF433 family)
MALVDRLIEHDPAIRGGNPRIAGTRITVHDIVIMHLHLGQSLQQIAGKYKLSPAAVHAAMAYYFDNKARIDSDIAADDAYFDAFKRDNPSRLQERLRELGRG